jgi:hypothetical protein
MGDLRNPVREVMSRGAFSVEEKLTSRSLAAVLAELFVIDDFVLAEPVVTDSARATF